MHEASAAGEHAMWRRWQEAGLMVSAVHISHTLPGLSVRFQEAVTDVIACGVVFSFALPRFINCCMDACTLTHFQPNTQPQ
jgi:hypothetical protein